MHPVWTFPKSGDTSPVFLIGTIITFIFVGLIVYLMDRFNKKK